MVNPKNSDLICAIYYQFNYVHINLLGINLENDAHMKILVPVPKQ